MLLWLLLSILDYGIWFRSCQNDFWLTWKKISWVCVMICVSPSGQRGKNLKPVKVGVFFILCQIQSDIFQFHILTDNNLYWALPVYTHFDDLHIISRSLHCKRGQTETSCIWLLHLWTRSCARFLSWLWLVFKGEIINMFLVCSQSWQNP